METAYDESAAQHRLSRRDWLKSAAAATGAAAMGALAGCQTTAVTGGGASAPAAAPPAAAAATDPEQILKKLLDGNARYADAAMTHPDQTVQRRLDLAKGQQPFAVVLACSDSRVPPEIIFDQGLGDLFIVRVAGNVIDDDVLGSIEYAVGELKTPLVIVLGHVNCGAVKAAIAAVERGGEVPGHIANLVEKIAPNVKQAKTLPGDAVANTVAANVRRSVELITTDQPFLSDVIKNGKLKVVGANYDFNTGRVALLDA